MILNYLKDAEENSLGLNNLKYADLNTNIEKSNAYALVYLNFSDNMSANKNLHIR